jgi:hypothetical protein
MDIRQFASQQAEYFLQRYKKLSKSKMILGASLAIISIEAYLGGVLGYVMAKVFSGAATAQQGKLKSLIVRYNKYQIHIHHWVVGMFIIALNFHYHFLPFSHFAVGLIGGTIVQGIMSYSDWHKIIKK